MSLLNLARNQHYSHLKREKNGKMHEPSLKVGSRIWVWGSTVRFHLLENWHTNSSLVSDGRRERRGAGRALALVLTLDETVGNTEDGVDDDGIDAFCDLVL
jgi:hypothetical protein